MKNINQKLNPKLCLIVIGIALITLFLVVSILSQKFAYEKHLEEKPILVFFTISFIAGFLYLFIIPVIKTSSNHSQNLILIIIVGLIIRISMCLSTPILEDDFYRYLWDGAVISNGFNPYIYPPEQILNNSEIDIPDGLIQLADESGNVIHRINHPYVRTIYPILSQFFFAISYQIKPWNLFAWRFVLLIVDLSILLLLFFILRHLQLSPLWIAVYWWNPLLIKEIFNSAHMDILILPFLLGSIYLSFKQKYIFSTLLLALSTCVKLWPIVLLPIILKPLFSKPRQLIIAIGLFALIIFLAFMSAHPLENQESSAFKNYSTRWEMNDSIFKLILWTSQSTLTMIGIHPGHGQLVARIAVLLITFTLIFYIISRVEVHELTRTKHMLFLIAAIFLISPTQFPWYAIWMLPFLTILPRYSLLILTPLLSIYYLRYYLQSIGHVELFDNYIVWVQYIPVWILLLTNRILKRKEEYNITIV